MADLPAPWTHGEVVGKILVAKGDDVIAPDAGDLPDTGPVSGTVTFTPSPRKLVLPTGSPVTVIPYPVTFTLDGTGSLPADSTLIATDNDAVTPVDWTYRVSFNLTDEDDAAVSVDPFDIAVPGGTIVDLSVVAPVSASNGAAIIQGPEGPEGPAGPPGPGIPAGGTTAQVLAKVSNADGDTEWADAGTGDMAAATYDPTAVAGDAFNRANFHGTDADLTAHLNDATDAHDATAISTVPAGGLAAVNVQAALDELDTEKATTGSVATVSSGLAAHLADTTDAHAASAITNTPAGAVAATTVQGAINELDSEKASTGSVTTVANDLAAHLADAVDAHDASAVSYVPGGTVAATDVQAAIAEVAAEALQTSMLDTDGNLAANSDTKIASQKAVKTYVGSVIAATDVMIFKGVIDCSANPNYPAADAGNLYRVSVAGKIGGASGVVVQAGDEILCLVDGTASGNQATVGANWNVTQANIDGAVVGPTGAVTDSHFVQWDTTSGRLVKGGLALDTDGTLAAASATRVPSQSAVKTYADTKQPSNANLTTISGLTATTDNMLQAVAGAWASRTPAQVKTALAIVAADLSNFASAADARIAAAVGVSVQAFNAALGQIAGLTPSNDDFLQRKAGAWANRTVAQVKTDLAIDNVTNTSDANKPVSTAQQTALDLKRNLAQTVINDTTTAHTVTSAMSHNIITRSNAGASTETIDGTGGSMVPIGASFDIINLGAGAVTLTPGTGTPTIRTSGAGLKLLQWKSCTVIRIAANEYYAVGALTA